MSDETFRHPLTTNAPSQAPAFRDISERADTCIFRTPLGEWVRVVLERAGGGYSDVYISPGWGRGPGSWPHRARLPAVFKKGETPCLTLYQWFWQSGGTIG